MGDSWQPKSGIAASFKYLCDNPTSFLGAFRPRFLPLPQTLAAPLSPPDRPTERLKWAQDTGMIQPCLRWWQNSVGFTFKHLGSATRLTLALDLELSTSSGVDSFSAFDGSR